MEAIERALGIRIRGVRVHRLELSPPRGLVVLRELAHDTLSLVPLATEEVAHRGAERLRAVEHHE